MDEGEEPLHVGIRDRAAIGALDEGAHQARRVVLRIFRDDIDGDIVERGDPAAGVAALLGLILVINHGQGNAGRAALRLGQWQIAEKEPVARGRVFVGERAGDFHPAKCYAGCAVGRHQRVHETSCRIGPRAVESRSVGDERLVRVEPDLADVVNGGLGCEIE